MVIPLVKGYKEVEVPPDTNGKTRRLDPLQAKFEGLAPSAQDYLKGLGSSHVGHLREQMEKIISLGSVHSSGELDRAMRQAVNYRSYGFGVLKGILRHLSVVPVKVVHSAEFARVEVVVPDVQVERRGLDYYGNVGWQE